MAARDRRPARARSPRSRSPRTPRSSAPAGSAPRTSGACSPTTSSAVRRRRRRDPRGEIVGCRGPGRGGRADERGAGLRRRRDLPGGVRDAATSSASPTSSCATSDGRWIVQDTKLARHARVTALMQLAAYVDQLDRLGVARSDRVELLLGDGSVSVHEVDDLLPVFGLRRERLARAHRRPPARPRRRGRADRVGRPARRARRRRVRALRDLRRRGRGIPRSAARRRHAPGAARAAARRRHRDDRRARDAPPRPRGHEPRHVRDAAHPGPAAAREPRRHAGAVPAGGRPAGDAPTRRRCPRTEVVAPTALGALPRPDHGDLFFDFEGDPLYTEPLPPGRDDAQWGIDYLFGWVDDREQYTRAVGALLRRREAGARELPRHRESAADAASRHAHLPLRAVRADASARDGGPARRARGRRRSAAARRRVRRPVPDRAARAAGRVAVVLDQEARAALHGRRGAHQRRAEGRRLDRPVRRGARSRARTASRRPPARSSTTSPTTTGTTACRRGGCATGSSTARAKRGCAPRRTPSPARRPTSRRSRALTLSSLASHHPADSAEAQSLRLGAAAIDYYPREAKTFWATHFLRLREPVSVWEETRDVAVIDSGAQPRRRGLALPRERARRRAPHPRAARRARARHPAERGLQPVRAVRAAGAVPVRGVAALDPLLPVDQGRRGARRRRDRRRDRRRRRHLDAAADRAHARRRRRGR